MNESNLIDLAAAIIDTACQDYIDAYIRGSKKAMKKCTDFFENSWFDELCFNVDLNKKYFMETLKIRGEYTKWRRKHRCYARKCKCVHNNGGEWQKWYNGTALCAKEDKINPLEKDQRKGSKVINLTTGEIFENVTEASEKCGIAKTYLYKLIKEHKPAKGNMWSYYKIE